MITEFTIDRSKCDHMALFQARKMIARVKQVLEYGDAPAHLGGGRTMKFVGDDGQTYIAPIDEVQIRSYFTPVSLIAALS